MTFSDNWYEIIGHLATVFIVLGVMQKSVTRVRICMVMGSLCFIIYGVIIYAMPVVIANATIGLVSLKYLIFNKS
jgi:hypothetical protein